jgi:MFS transporter, DHA1 family, tetracycline resistance protein
MTTAREDTLPGDTPPAPPKGALLTIFLIVFTDFLGFGIIIPLLPFYIPNYAKSASDPIAALKVTALFSIYSVCQFIGAPILGAISDRFGRKPVLGVSQLGSSAGYLLLGIASHWLGANPGLVLLLVYISRIVDGFTGGNVSTAQAYIADITTKENRGKAMGLLGAAFGIGFSAGPAIGGILGHYNVAWPAYVAAVFSFIAAMMSFVYLPESRTHKPADIEAWLHPSQFTPVLKRPIVLQLLLISFTSMAAFVMMEATIGIFLNRTFGYHEKQVGYFFGFVGLIIIVIQGGLIGRLIKKFGEWPLAIAGPFFVSIGMLFYMRLAWSPWVITLGAAGAITAAGRSFQQPTVSSLLSKYADPNEQGVTFGLYHGLSSIARVIGPVVAGLTYPLLNNTGHFLTAAILVLIAAAWTAALKKRAAHS